MAFLPKDAVPQHVRASVSLPGRPTSSVLRDDVMIALIIIDDDASNTKSSLCSRLSSLYPAIVSAQHPSTFNQHQSIRSMTRRRPPEIPIIYL